MNTALDFPAASPARVDEVGPDAPLPHSEVADLFLTLDKAVRAQRLYQPNNPVYQGFVAAAKTAVGRLWDRIGSLTAAVDESSFRWYGRSFNAGEGRDSLPFLFYKDGIRFITFLPGFEHDVERLLDVINRTRAGDQNGDDMVTLLWQQEFTSFQYSYVDALAEGLQVPQSSVPKLAGIELTLVADDLAGKVKSDSPSPPSVAAGEPPVAGLVNRSDFEETLYFLDTNELARLHREVELEWSRDVKADVLAALFDRLEEGLPEWRIEILRILRQMLPVFLGSGDLGSATRILVELNAILERGLTGEPKQEAEQLFRDLGDPVVLKQLMNSLEDGSIDPTGTELGVFLQHLGPEALPVLLVATERTDVVALQDRLREAIEGLATRHRDRIIALLAHADNDVLRGAARLAGQLAMTESTQALGKLLDHSDALVRRAAIEALVRIRSSSGIEPMLRALMDVDREVRVAAARGIAALRYPPARARLEELLDSKIVRDADLTEKLAFFEAYGSVANAESVAMLDRMLNGRRIFGKESADLRACAAMALGRVGSPAARAALARASNENNPVVRNAVLKALRQEQA